MSTDASSLHLVTGSTAVELAGTPGTAARAREWVRDQLAGVDLEPEFLDDLLVVCSELVSNAVVHGRSPITLQLGRASHTVTVVVADHGHATGTVVARSVAPQSARGRGLRLVAVLAEAWGVDEAASGTTVWATVRVGFADDLAAATATDHPEDAARRHRTDHGLSLIETAARSSGVHLGRWSVGGDERAVHVAVGGTDWLVYPVSTGWVAAQCEPSGGPDLARSVWLRRSVGETHVPFVAWARFAGSTSASAG